MKYALAPVAAVLALCACATEPVGEPYFEGAVTAVWIVKDVFENSETMHLEVIKDRTKICQQAEVTVTGTTYVSYLGTPIRVGSEALKSAHAVRASPLPANDGCPLDIHATKVVIVG